jgi:2-polyprenyl-3-methyl-5-hydroxy-6-metoxy-1,4-benzoquinol methylase
METLSACNLCGNESIENVDEDWNLCRCPACGYVFDSPRPAMGELETFYAQPSKYDLWLQQEAGRDKLWKRRLKKLACYRTPGNLLDVGAGIGQFLHHAKPFFTQVTGTEISANAIAIAREKYGIELHAGQVEEMQLPLESFDNVTAIHVLEHVPDPVRFVRRCHQLLRPGGTFVVAVPNDVLGWRSSLYRLGKKMGLAGFSDYSPVLGIAKAGTGEEIHLSHFTARVLRWLLQYAGFTVVEESLDPAYPSNGWRLVLDTLYYLFHFTLLRISGANRYDTIWMVGRKPGRT